MIMRHLLQFLALILTFKVFCHFALSLQTIHRCFAVLNWEMANCEYSVDVCVYIINVN